MSWSARNSMSSYRWTVQESSSCCNSTNIGIVLSLIVAGAAGGLAAFFIQASTQLKGFIPGTASPLVGVWWGLFLAVWAFVLFVEISSRKCLNICESRSGPRWFLGLLSAVAVLVHLMAAGCMIFTKFGYDIFGGSLAFAATAVSIAVLLSVIYRVRTVEAPAVAIVLEEEADDSNDPAPDIQEVGNVVAASMLPDEDVERALLLPASPRASFNAGLGLGGSSGTAGAVLLMSQRALRRQSRSTFKAAFAGPRFCRFSLIMLDIFLVIVLVAESFAAYQSVATTVDAAYMAPPPGKLIPVANGAYKLHLYCIDRVPDAPINSTGAPEASNPPSAQLQQQLRQNITVILESGLGAVSNFWTFVQPELVNRSSLSVDRVCSYDRAGYGWSQGGQFPRTSSQIVSELNDLLINGNITGPLVLVGHSFGGLNVRLFAARYPERVAGLVLIDSMHEFQNVQFDAALNVTYPADPSLRPEALVANQARILSPIGLFRIANTDQRALVWKQLPPDAQSVQIAWSSVNSFPAAIWSEGIYTNTESSAEVNRTRYAQPDGQFGQLPLAVLSAGLSINGTCAAMNYTEDSSECKHFKEDIKKTGPVQYEFQRDLATLSKNSSWTIVWQSGHNIPLEYPEVVIQTILDISQKARQYQQPQAPTAA